MDDILDIPEFIFSLEDKVLTITTPISVISRHLDGSLPNFIEELKYLIKIINKFEIDGEQVVFDIVNNECDGQNGCKNYSHITVSVDVISNKECYERLIDPEEFWYETELADFNNIIKSINFRIKHNINYIYLKNKVWRNRDYLPRIPFKFKFYTKREKRKEYKGYHYLFICDIRNEYMQKGSNTLSYVYPKNHKNSSDLKKYYSYGLTLIIQNTIENINKQYYAIKKIPGYFKVSFYDIKNTDCDKHIGLCIEYYEDKKLYLSESIPAFTIKEIQGSKFNELLCSTINKMMTELIELINKE